MRERARETERERERENEREGEKERDCERERQEGSAGLSARIGSLNPISLGGGAL